MATRPEHHPPLPQLTAKQREVIALVADNRTSKEIACLLGISESAVNQRIEMIRTRLGGIPRGELARRYRLECESAPAPTVFFPPDWQKIQVPETSTATQDSATESISVQVTAGSQSPLSPAVDGSQLSVHSSLPGAPDRLHREGPFTLQIRFAALALIVLVAMVIGAQLALLVR